MFKRLLMSLVALAVLSAGFTAALRADGLIVVSTPNVSVPGHFTFAPLEVVYHKVETKITDQVAETFVDQEFYNPNGQILEGDYIFPVPAGAHFSKFTMDIDGKQVEAELLPAEKARAIYTEIVRKAKDPALLEYAGRDMFRVHIYPIPANGRKQITLKYTELLKMDNGLVDYHYTLNTEKFSSKPLQNVSMKVTIDCSEPITTLYSPTHEVDKVMKGDKSATVGFEAKNIRPDQDFHLFIGHKTSPVGISLLSYRPDPTKEGYFVLLAAPSVSKDIKPMPKDVVFVIDTSGSMSGDKIEQTRKALKYCIDTLNPGDRFDIVRFSTEAEPLFGSMKDATADNRKTALEFAAGLHAAGGTAIDEAFNKAVLEVNQNLLEKRTPQTTLRMVVFMTDGQPTIGEQNPDAILRHSIAQATGVRVFSFGVGVDVNAKLLDLMSGQSHGYSQYVLPNENLELSMSSFWGKVQEPIIAGIKVDTGAVALSRMYPKEMPDLFKGDQLVVFGSYAKAGKSAVVLTGMVNGAEQKFAQDVTFEEKTDTSKEWIAKLWATRRVGYLLDEIRLHGESKEVKDEVVELARRWGIVTPYTAMLIIEDERARGVPLAQRSLREMEFDARAAGNTAALTDSLRRGEVAGGVGVGNGMNTSAMRDTMTLDGADKVAAQSEARLQFADQSGASLAKGPDAPSAAAPGSTVGGFAGAGGGGAGGRGGGVTITGGTIVMGSTPGGPVATPTAAATAPSIRQDELNLGERTKNGWQPADGDKKNSGYRVVSNYAQQTRMINNRSFFLNGNQWTDANVQTAARDARHVKVVFNSDDYFALLARNPDATQYLSLGNNISLELGGIIYDIVEETSAPQPK